MLFSTITRSRKVSIGYFLLSRYTQSDYICTIFDAEEMISQKKLCTEVCFFAPNSKYTSNILPHTMAFVTTPSVRFVLHPVWTWCLLSAEHLLLSFHTHNLCLARCVWGVVVRLWTELWERGDACVLLGFRCFFVDRLELYCGSSWSTKNKKEAWEDMWADKLFSFQQCSDPEWKLCLF